MGAKKMRVVVVEDDKHILKFIVRNLKAEGYEVLTATDGALALELITAQRPDIVLLDLMLPEMDGFRVCESVRRFSTIPIIIVTSRGQNQDKIRGFDLGADDYLTKPFSVEELLVRIRAVLRRAQFTVNERGYALQTTMTIGSFSINESRHLVTVAGREIALPPLEYRLLLYLAQNAGRVLTQEQLLEHIWGDAYTGEGHLLRVHMSRLRSKLEPDPAHPRYLFTRIGIGYLLAPE